MSNLFWLNDEQISHLKPYFPKSRGRLRVDDKRLSIIFIIRNGSRCCDAPPEYGPYKTLYNRFVRWSQNGVFKNIFRELFTSGAAQTGMRMIDASHLKVYRTALNLKKGGEPSLIGRIIQYLWSYE